MDSRQAPPDMVAAHVFDAWSDGYDEEVRIADGNNEYPFAGYGQIMSGIYNA